MAATGACRCPGTGLRRVQLAAADAVERQLAAFGLEERLIPAVVVNPDPEEKHEDDDTIGDCAGGEIHVLRRPTMPAW